MFKLFFFSISTLFAYSCWSLSLKIDSDASCCSYNIKRFFDDNGNLTRIEKIQDGNIVERLLFHENIFKGGFRLQYISDKFTEHKFINNFEVFDENNFVQQSYSTTKINNHLQTSSNFENRAIIVEIDGIDFNHNDFTNKIFINKKESLNFSDSDLNGLTDDIAGFTFYPKISSNLHILQPVISPHNLLDASHGTAVTSIAAQNTLKTSFIPVSGDIREEEFYRHLGRYIERLSVRFINMSLSFRIIHNIHLDDKNSFIVARQNLSRLINNNKNSLFVISAGNGCFLFSDKGINIDLKPHYPASIKAQNTLVVGSINSYEISDHDFYNYKMSDFSNYGFKTVDILAPGENLKGALAGGGHSTFSGTSFAAPYVLNIALKIAERLPTLKNHEIKELILKTAFIPDIDLAVEVDFENLHGLNEFTNQKVLPVRSGGIINPTKIFNTLKLLERDSNMSVEEAILRLEGNPQKAEKLKKLWKIRKI